MDLKQPRHMGSPSYSPMDLGQQTWPTSMHHGPGPGSYPQTIPGAFKMTLQLVGTSEPNSYY